MKKTDWLVAGLLIALGLSCFTMSITFLDHSPSVHSILSVAVQCIVWLCLPLIGIGVISIWMKKRGGKKK